MFRKKHKYEAERFSYDYKRVRPFFWVLGILTVISFIIPLRPTQSYIEKRNLAEFPEFSFSALVDGSYFDDITLWFSDTFPGREDWISLSSSISSLHGHSEIAIQGELSVVDEIPVVTEPQQTPETEPDAPQESEEVPAETEETEEGEEQTQEEELQPAELLGKGGSVYLEKGSVCNISGGTVCGGVAGLGGNIYVDGDETDVGVLNISGGTVSGGEAMFHGGNIYVLGTVNMSAGEIAQGQAYSNGGNIYLEGTLEMTGGVLREGRCDYNSLSGKRGGNLLVNGLYAVVHIANAEILDGDGHGSENFGGNICVMGQCAREFTITDTVISGGQGHRGGNVYFGTLAKDVDPENLDYYMKNVTISGGTCSYRGANLCMDSDLKGVYVELVMDNCVISLEDTSRETISLGAGAAADTWARLTMNGGAIEGGNITLYGDATLTANGTKLSTENYGGLGEMIINP